MSDDRVIHVSWFSLNFGPSVAHTKENTALHTVRSIIWASNCWDGVMDKQNLNHQTCLDGHIAFFWQPQPYCILKIWQLSLNFTEIIHTPSAMVFHTSFSLALRLCCSASFAAIPNSSKGSKYIWNQENVCQRNLVRWYHLNWNGKSRLYVQNIQKKIVDV